MQDEFYKDQIRSQVSSVEGSSNKLLITLLKSGRNNKVFKVSSEEKDYLAKFYYPTQSLNDSKLEREYSFLNFLKKVGIENVPKPLFKNNEQHLAFYEFIEGKNIKQSHITKEYLLLAAKFFSSINSNRESSFAKSIGIASDSFIDPLDFLEKLEIRIQNLESSINLNPSNQRALKFIKELKGKWNKVKEETKKIKNLTLGRKGTFLSPSDFGFHNCLRKKDGSLVFIDFEYAGWDDSAKFLCDFFIQPDFNISEDYFEEFASAALRGEVQKELLTERALFLFPLFRIKWCCIIMNEFIPEVLERRKFSDPDVDISLKQDSQLKKAEMLLTKI